MAYGKDAGHLGTIGGYGATTAQQMGNATRRVSVQRKGSPPWANNFKPSEHAPDLIRIIPGSYTVERLDSQGNVYTETVPWFEHTEHFHGGIQKSSICSAGVFRMVKDKAKPCRGCDIYWEDWRARKAIETSTGVKPTSPNRMSFSSKYDWNILDYGHFFKVPQLDEMGRPRINPNSGEPYMVWEKWTGPQQNEAYGAAKEKRQGMIKAWPQGHDQFVTLSGYADIVQKHCVNCRNQHCIYTSGYVCPSCNAPTFDNQTSLNPDQIKEVVSQRVVCRHCNQSAYPRAVLQCSGCQNPKPAMLYDVDMQVQRVKSGQNRWQLIIPWIGPPGPIDPQFADLVSKPLDLQKKFAETPNDDQIAIFGAVKDNGAQPGQPQYANYAAGTPTAPAVPNQPAPQPGAVVGGYVPTQNWQPR